MNTILLAYDDTSSGKSALQRAPAMTAQLDAELVVITVAPVVNLGRMGRQTDLADTPARRDQVLADARAYLNRAWRRRPVRTHDRLSRRRNRPRRRGARRRSDHRRSAEHQSAQATARAERQRGGASQGPLHCPDRKGAQASGRDRTAHRADTRAPRRLSFGPRLAPRCRARHIAPVPDWSWERSPGPRAASSTSRSSRHPGCQPATSLRGRETGTRAARSNQNRRDQA